MPRGGSSGSAGVTYRPRAVTFSAIEGIAWLDDRTLVCVSDQKKSRQPAKCEKRDQSIHVFRIPPAAEGG